MHRYGGAYHGRSQRGGGHSFQNRGLVGYTGSSKRDIEDLLGCLTIVDESGELCCRRVAQKAVIFPQKYEGVDHNDNSSVQEYLAACKQNILAEVWGFLQRTTHSFPGWRQKLLEAITLEDIRLNESQDVPSNPTFSHASRKKKEGLTEKGSSEPVRLEEIASYLVIFRNRLCLTRSVRDGMEIMQGADLDSLNKPDSGSSKERNTLYLIGYARPYVEDLATVLMFTNNILPADQILRAVASPVLRQPFAFDSREFSSVVPSNPVQRDIILRLGHNLEGVQGPPGTGPPPLAARTGVREAR
jgi:hypothetical protein